MGTSKKDREGQREGQTKEMKETRKDKVTQRDIRGADGDKQKRQRGTKGGTDKRNERDKEGQSDTKGHKGGRWGQAKKTERDCGRDKKAKQDLNSRQIQGDTRGHKGGQIGTSKKRQRGTKGGTDKRNESDNFRFVLI